MNDEVEKDAAPGTPSRVANAFAWLLIVAGDGLAIWRGYIAVTSYRQGLRDRLFDPPAAELARQQFRSSGAIAAAGLLLAAVGMVVLLRAARRP